MHVTDDNEHFLRLASIGHYDLKSSPAFEPLFRGVCLVKAKKHYVYKEHRHPAFEYIIPTKQTYKCRLNGVYIEVPPGKFLLVQTNDIHQDIFEPGLEFCCVTFDLKDSDLLKNKTMLFKSNTTMKRRIGVLASDLITKSTLKMFLTESIDKGVFAFYVLNGLCKAFFWKTLESFTAKELTPIFIQSAKNEDFRNTLICYFEKNLNMKVNVAHMALAMNMSESSLTHKSTQILSVPPAKAFMNFKMTKAMTLLNESDTSVKEISEILGFKDQFHFSKNFKKHFKKPPSSFK